MNNEITQQNEPTAEDVSILYWILKNGVKSEKGDALDFKDRLFLLDILTDWSPRIVWKKCSQVGGSVIFVLKTLFAVKNLGLSVILTYPSDSDAEEFVKTKTNPILRENIHLFPGISTDSVYLKQIGNRNLHVKGTISKTAAISTTADLVVHDEASRSDQQAMAFYQSRIKASEYKGTWMFSNPTTKSDAMDIEWEKSDKKEWFVTCDNGHEQTLTWPESIDKERKCFQCKECGVLITTEQRRKGKWKKTADGEISGYHTSHLIAPWISAKEIIEDSTKDQEYFYNFVLGEPYNPGDLSITRSLILDNWTPRDLSKGKEWYLGVDVGNIKHYVLGTELGVVKVGKFSDWSELDDMMNRYNPTLVIDALPDTTMSRYFVNSYQKAYMSFFQENSANPQTIVWWGLLGEHNTQSNKEGIVYSNRNRVIDQMIDHILQAKMLFGMPSDASMRDFIDHFLRMRRIKETDAKGVERYVWTSTTTENHFCFATLYFYLAQLSGGSGTILTLPKEAPTLIGRDNKVGDFAQAFSEAYE